MTESHESSAMDPETYACICRQYHQQYAPWKTEVVCMTAVQADGSALQYVPLDLNTEVVCMAAWTMSKFSREFFRLVLA